MAVAHLMQGRTVHLGGTLLPPFCVFTPATLTPSSSGPARIRGVDLRKHYNQSRIDIEWHHFEFVERTYRHYKASRNLMDFTDLLELACLHL